MITGLIYGVGFSVGTALLLSLALWTAYRDYALPWPHRSAGTLMLLGLALTQVAHGQYLQDGAEIANRIYGIVLLLQSAGYYWLFLGVLRPAQALRPVEYLPFALLAAAGWWLPPAVLIVVTLALGTTVSLHLALLVYRLRAQRRWFQLELRVIAAFGVMAVTVALLGLAAPWLSWRYFVAIYSALISLSFALVLYLLLRFPDLLRKTEEAVSVAYAVSTLSKVDVARAVAQLNHLLDTEKIYVDESLHLASVAGLCGLSTHQLSELVNTQFAMSFSRLLRSKRVAAAQAMLVDEPRASVLSVGMAVGFSSQSNFYSAFKEITGTVPGQFRSQALERFPV